MTPRFRREGALGREMVAVMPGTAPLTARWFSRRIACRSGLGGYPGLRPSASGGPNVIRGCRLTAQSTQTGTPRSRKSTTGYTPPQPSSIGLLAVEWKAAGDVIGSAGLIDSGQGSDSEPELAYELLRLVWGQETRPRPPGLSWTGPDRLGTNRCGPAGVDTASRRVLTKLGFTETCKDVDPIRGTSLLTTRRL